MSILIPSRNQYRLRYLPYDLNFEKIVEEFVNSKHNHMVFSTKYWNEDSTIYLDTSKYYYDTHNDIRPMREKYYVKNIIKIKKKKKLKI